MLFGRSFASAEGNSSLVNLWTPIKTRLNQMGFPLLIQSQLPSRLPKDSQSIAQDGVRSIQNSALVLALHDIWDVNVKLI